MQWVVRSSTRLLVFTKGKVVLKTSAEMETVVIEWRLYRSWALRSARALVSSLVNRKYQPSQHSGKMLFGALIFLSIARMIWHFWSSNLHRTVCCHTQLLISRYRVRCRSNFVFLTLRYFFLISFLVSIVSHLFL